MPASRKPRIRRIKRTDEQKETGEKLLEFFKENKIKDGDEITLTIYRLACLDFTGGSEHTLKIVHEKLPVAFDKYIEHGFKLTDKEKSFLHKNKDKIISLIKPFFWEEDGNVVGMDFQMHLPDFVDGFVGVFNIDTDDFMM